MNFPHKNFLKKTIEEIEFREPVQNKKPLVNKMKDDFSFMLTKYAEIFVNTDKLKKEILLEELSKFRELNKIEIENMELKEELKMKEKEIEDLRKRKKIDHESYISDVVSLKKRLIEERKDKLIMMNDMIKAIENEKNTRVKVLGILKGEEDGGDIEKKRKMKDRLSQNVDDVEFYKARLIEKIIHIDDETAVRHNARNFNRRKITTDEGITFYGNAKNLDHIYDIIQKIKKNIYPLDSQQRRTALEEIALYIQTKNPSFLRYFGFVDGILASVKSQDEEIVETSLYVLSKLAQDHILATEMVEAGGFETVQQTLLSRNEFLRLLSLAVYDPLCKLEDVRKRVDRKEIVILLIYLEEYLLKNIFRGCYLLWSIMCSLSQEYELRRHLIQNGCVRLISLGFDISGSQKTNQLILQTLKNLSKEPSMEKYSSGEKVLDNLIKMIETASEENLVTIIEILSYTATASKTESGLKANSKLLKKVLNMGIESNNKIKFTVLKVLRQLFLAGSELLGRINTERIATLIYAAFTNGKEDIKTSACDVLIQMIRRNILELAKEPDLVYQIILGCTDPDSRMVRMKCIDIIYQMTMSVHYLSIILLNAAQIIKMIKSALSIFHPEIGQGLYQNNFLLFDKLDLKSTTSKFYTVNDEDLVTHISSLEEMKSRFVMENERIKSMRKYDKDLKKHREDIAEDGSSSGRIDLDNSEHDISTTHLVHQRSHAFSDPSEFNDDDQSVMRILKEIVDYGQKNDIEDIVHHVVMDQTNVYVSTTKLVKIVNILMSCDIVYPMLMSVNFQALFAILIEKSIGHRYLDLIDAIFAFYSNLFDILLLRGGIELSEPLREMSQLISERFVVRALKVIYKEIDNKFINWNILCTLISLILRLLMKEETAETLIKYSKLGELLERVIKKGLQLKSSNILIMCTLLATHLSAYPELQPYLLNREFIAFLMGLLEPGDNEFITKWKIGDHVAKDRVLAGESLFFLQRLLSNTDTTTHLISIILHNLADGEHLAKILASLPVKYGVRPLFRIYLTDKMIVANLIQSLCLDSDFQAKISSFVPVNFAIMGEDMKSKTFTELRKIINNPVRAEKEEDYHSKIGKTMFQHTSVNDLLWRRLIKISLVSFFNLPEHSKLWSGRLLRPTKLKIDYENVAVYEDFHMKEDEEEDEDLNRFYFKQETEEMVVYPEESMSGILLGLGRYKEEVEMTKDRQAKKMKLLEDMGDKKKNKKGGDKKGIENIHQYYKRKRMYKHQESEDDIDFDKRNMNDILKEEIRNIRNPKYYGRGARDEDNDFPVRDDIPQKDSRGSDSKVSQIIGLGGGIDSYKNL